MADLPPAGATSFTRQQAPLGLGHAVWCAREIVGDEPFAVLLPDMITMASGKGKSRCLAQCIAAYEKHGGNIIAVEEVAPEETHQYGIVSVGKDHGHTFEITGMVEKPPQGTAPSNLYHLRPLHPRGRDFPHSREGRKGRRRRNPADRRHDRTRQGTQASMACASTASPMIAAPGSVSSPPMSLSRWHGRILRRPSGQS